MSARSRLLRPPRAGAGRAAWWLAGCAAALLPTGCNPDIPPQRQPLPPASQSALDTAAAAAEDTQAVLYVYSPVGKRDPFRDFSTGGRIAVPVGDASRRTPLQKFEIDQLRLQFTVTGTSSPMAMIIDPNARGHIVKVGDFVGKNWGKVSHIGREEITITETIADQQTGRVYPVYIPMRMPRTEAETRARDDLESAGAGEGSR